MKIMSKKINSLLVILLIFSGFTLTSCDDIKSKISDIFDQEVSTSDDDEDDDDETDKKKKNKKKRKESTKKGSNNEDYNEEYNEEYSESYSDISDAKKELREMIAAANEYFPLDFGYGVICNSLSLSSDYVIYNYTVDESILSIEQAKENTFSNRETFYQLLQNDPKLIEACKKGNVGVIYYYEGNYSGESFSLTFESYEL